MSHSPTCRSTIRLRECVHDYFFVKSLPLLKSGGILASITSRYTLDKRKNVVRRHLAMHMGYRSMRLRAESVPNPRSAGCELQ